MSEEDLLFLLEQSRNRNKRQNVTGMLLYAGGNFFQVLEGEKEDVEEIYEAICQDDRNTGNILVIKGPIDERVFSNWWMGFSRLTVKDKDRLEGYTEFLDRDMEPEEFAHKPDRVLRLLYRFKEGNK